MILPSAKQVKAGNEVATEMFDASIQKSMYGMGGCKKFKISNFKYKAIVRAYLNEEIDSVTGIWIAMQEAEFQ